MFRVQILNQNGLEVHAEDYIKSSDDILCCPDPNCHAQMLHVKEGQKLGSIQNPTHFRTKPGAEHVNGCTAHREEREFKKCVESMRDALIKNKIILFSFNDAEHTYGLPKPLRLEFETESCPEFKKTEVYQFKKENVGNFKSISVPRIEILVSLLFEMEALGQPEAFERSRIAWQGKIATYAYVVNEVSLDGLDLVRSLYVQAKDSNAVHRFEVGNDIGAYGFPRVQTFEMPRWAKGFGKGRLLLPSTTIEINGNARLSFQHALDIGRLNNDDRQKLLHSDRVRIAATPKVNRKHVDAAVSKYRGGGQGYIHLAWTIAGAHQFQSLLSTHEKPARSLPVALKRALVKS